MSLRVMIEAYKTNILLYFDISLRASCTRKLIFAMLSCCTPPSSLWRIQPRRLRSMSMPLEFSTHLRLREVFPTENTGRIEAFQSERLYILTSEQVPLFLRDSVSSLKVLKALQ